MINGILEIFAGQKEIWMKVGKIHIIFLLGELTFSFFFFYISIIIIYKQKGGPK